MDALVQWEKRLRTLTIEAQEKEILKIAAEFEHVAVDMNTGQLLDGKDSKNQFLAPYRSEEYAEFKGILNPKRVTDLKLEGKFHASFFQDAKQFPIEIFATDLKTGRLVDQYGEDIFGLNPENTKDFADQLKPEIIQFYSRVLPIR
jgi:hypothetical protein